MTKISEKFQCYFNSEHSETSLFLIRGIRGSHCEKLKQKKETMKKLK
jgi:hypothetical protein